MTRSRGDDEVRRFTELMVEVGPALLAYFERRVGHDGADLLAETMATAWKRRRSLPAEPEPARMWLFGVARNMLRNAHRTGIRRQHLADSLRARAEHTTASDPSEAIEMRDLIGRLDPDLAEVVTLVHWEGLSLTEIGRLLGIPASTARGRYQRARQTLRAQLESPARTAAARSRPTPRPNVSIPIAEEP
ncbi:RNA polymerase sigma factor [Compostimonas suwonensis]|uniref:RNA polymerase sigma-70 factor (ECF subfamily) n=1 Tax=Compostimonas suwonensis TaxID=1048394 RepID=A0A2M9C0M0_9MICO|nr:RNA polymerase sigma factor [Compostimonas suwonensis]PJJ63840.1 RNA polymerase sigma-70 factor (ECF subfamily) [Compostimonas suwonensis]